MEGALYLYEERLPLARDLSRSHFLNAVWQSTLATSLEDVAAKRVHHGDNDVALKLYAESLSSSDARRMTSNKLIPLG